MLNFLDSLGVVPRKGGDLLRLVLKDGDAFRRILPGRIEFLFRCDFDIGYLLISERIARREVFLINLKTIFRTYLGLRDQCLPIIDIFLQ